MYTVKTLDNRFTLHRTAGFQTMVEWPLCERLYRKDSVYYNYSRFESAVSKTLGGDKHYYRYANPDGVWTSDSLRIRDGRWRHRIFFKEHKHLTLLLML